MAYTTIDKPQDYFNTVLYTGNGSTQSITGVGFQPDWVWIKERNNTKNHRVFDGVRGATKLMAANNTDAEATNTDTLTSFDSDGFSLGFNNAVNDTSDTYVSWNWLAQNGTSANSDGSISSTVSANTTAGFSVVTYTGDGASSATIGHGLGAAPAVLINKTRSLSGYDWNVYHQSLGPTKYMYLSSNATPATATQMWNDTAPTSSVFTVGTYDNVNKSSATYVTYCFVEKQGYSKFGIYEGNGSSDGSFVYTGFSPAWVMIKRTDAAGFSWGIYDNKRPGFNEVDRYLMADQNLAEQSGNNELDLVSNGFKMTSSNAGNNANGGDYIYMAFAENPFVSSTGIPATAR